MVKAQSAAASSSTARMPAAFAAAIAVSVLRYGVSVVQVAPMIYATSH
jgi:hypothetical protein